jgi:hypothetical protein
MVVYRMLIIICHILLHVSGRQNIYESIHASILWTFLKKLQLFNFVVTPEILSKFNGLDVRRKQKRIDINKLFIYFFFLTRDAQNGLLVHGDSSALRGK